MIRIKIEKSHVNLYSDDRQSAIYSIAKEELSLTILDSNCENSAWIWQLMSKSWIEEKVLYDLAVVIQNEYPQNSIDWKNTFFPFEKKLYIDHVKVIKKISSENKNTSAFDDIKIGIEEQNKFINEEVSKIVSIKLKEYGLK